MDTIKLKTSNVAYSPKDWMITLDEPDDVIDEVFYLLCETDFIINKLELKKYD